MTSEIAGARRAARGKTGVPSPTRTKPTRPRDHLGRPLAWDAVNTLQLEDYDAHTVEENHRLGIGSFLDRRFFPAHEAWETAWKQARGTGDEEFYKGLSQMGAGYVHLLRGNAHGCVTLLGRAERRIGRYPDGHLGVATTALVRRLREEARRVRDGELAPGEDASFGLPPLLAGKGSDDGPFDPSAAAPRG